MKTNYVKAKNTKQNNKCGLFGYKDETINHIMSESGKLAQREYKTKHDWVIKLIYSELYKKLKVDHSAKWYMH